MGYRYAERHHRRVKRAEVEGGRLMLRGVRNLAVLFVVLWMLLAGFGLLLNVTHRAPPRDCWSLSCWHDTR